MTGVVPRNHLPLDSKGIGMVQECFALDTLETCAAARLASAGLSWDAIPLDDPGAIRRVSQFFETSDRTHWDRLAPADAEEVAVAVALIRPGPLEGGMLEAYLQNQARRWHNPVLEEIFAPTRGVVIWLHQLVQIGQAFGGLGRGEADELRRNAAKGRVEDVEACRPGFVEAAKTHMPADEAEEIFELFQTCSRQIFHWDFASLWARTAIKVSWLIGDDGLDVPESSSSGG